MSNSIHDQGLIEAESLVEFAVKQREQALGPVLNSITNLLLESVKANPYCTERYIGVELHLLDEVKSRLRLAGYDVEESLKRDERDSKVTLTVAWA